MDVITVATIVLVVTYGVFPKAALPESLLMSSFPRGTLLRRSPALLPVLRYKRLDKPPASGIIRITLG